MDEQQLTVDNHERSALQPVEELLSVGRGENRRDRVAAMRFRVSRRHCEQMEIVIAENGGRRVAERFHFAQHGERLGPAVDEIADEPQPVAARGKRYELQKLTQLRVAALNVADRVVAHCAGTARAAATTDETRGNVGAGGLLEFAPILTSASRLLRPIPSDV